MPLGEDLITDVARAGKRKELCKETWPEPTPAERIALRSEDESDDIRL
jgi:hypothetical protein